MQAASHCRLRTTVAGRLTGLALALALVAGCASSEPPPVSVESQEWTSPVGTDGQRLITDHYELRVTVRDDVLQDYVAPFMETAFQAYTGLIPPPTDSVERMPVYLFGTREEWALFVSRTFPDRARTYLHIHAGGFVDHPTATAVIWDVGRDRTLSLLGHEGFHQYMARCFPERIPPWLEEGSATQWEAFDLKRGRPVFTPRRNFLRRSDLRAALGPDGRFIPLSDLLRMNAGEAVLKTGSAVRTYYAQVWSTILFLQEGADGRYADAFAGLLADAGTERFRFAVSGYRATHADADRISPGEIIFRHYITEDLDTFMNEYRAYARALVR
jgi:hypothetical protein